MYRAFVKDLLQKDFNNNYQLIQYQKDKHKSIIEKLYSERYNEFLDKNWDRYEEFYEKGLVLLKKEEEYVAFAILNIEADKGYIWKIYLKEDDYVLFGTLVVEVAKKINELSIDKVHVKGNKFPEYLKKIGFKHN